MYIYSLYRRTLKRVCWHSFLSVRFRRPTLFTLDMRVCVYWFYISISYEHVYIYIYVCNSFITYNSHHKSWATGESWREWADILGFLCFFLDSGDRRGGLLPPRHWGDRHSDWGALRIDMLTPQGPPHTHTQQPTRPTAHTAQPALRPHRATPRVKEEPPQTRWPHSTGLCSPRSEGQTQSRRTSIVCSTSWLRQGVHSRHS